MTAPAEQALRRRRYGWWARQDSNLQPSGYEPLALTIELRARRCADRSRRRPGKQRRAMRWGGRWALSARREAVRRASICETCGYAGRSGARAAAALSRLIDSRRFTLARDSVMSDSRDGEGMKKRTPSTTRRPCCRHSD